MAIRPRLWLAAALITVIGLAIHNAAPSVAASLRIEVYEYGQGIQIPCGGTTHAGILEVYVYGSPAGQAAKLTTKVFLNGDELWHQHTGQVQLDPPKIDADIWQRAKSLGTYRFVAKTPDGAESICDVTRV